MIVTPMFAALFGVLYVLLAFNVVRLRIGGQIAYGDGDNRDLMIAIRTHANFAEYLPFTLLLLWFVESMTFSITLVFWLGTILLIGRVLHVLGMAYPKSLMICRKIGVVVTLSVILVASTRLLFHYLPISI